MPPPPPPPPPLFFIFCLQGIFWHSLYLDPVSSRYTNATFRIIADKTYEVVVNSKIWS